MGQTNITTEQEQALRDIKRNSSNQIVSYTIDTDTDLEYGNKKVPAVFINYNESTYNRTIDQLSDELIVKQPDVPVEITNQSPINERDLYVLGVSIKSSDIEAEEPKDVFSGRYEITPAALSFRGKNPDEIRFPDAAEGYGPNTHFGGCSYMNSTVRDASDGYLTYPGHKEMVWDNKVFGPELQQFGYRVTQELIDSGKDLNLRAVVGININHSNGSNVGGYVAFKRKRAGDFNNPSTRIGTVGKTHLASNGPHYDMYEIQRTITNNELTLDELWQVTTNFGSINDGVFVEGDKSVFIVTAYDSSTGGPIWPAPTNAFNGPTSTEAVSSDQTETRGA